MSFQYSDALLHILEISLNKRMVCKHLFVKLRKTNEQKPSYLVWRV